MFSKLREVSSFLETQESVSNKHRPFTEDEIDRLLSVIPDLPPYENIVFIEIARSIQDGIRDKLRYQLKRKIANPAILDDLEKELERQYNATVIRPGRAVGLDAGGAFGQTMTQSTLNTFHMAGVVSNVTGGIIGFQELISARQVRLQESSTIHFKDNTLDLQGILDIKDDITHLSVYDLRKDEPIVIEPPSSESYPYWYTLFLALHPDIELKNYWALRLELNIETLYSRGITMKELCNAIESECPTTVVCVPSPINIGIVDIYPIESNIEETSVISSVPDREFNFLSTSVKPCLSKITIRGIPGITDLTPAFLRVWATVLKEDYLDDATLRIDKDEKGKNHYHLETKWRLTLDDRIFNTSSLTIDRVIKLAEVTGLTVDEVEKGKDIFSKMYVTMPEVEVEPMGDINGMVQKMLKDGRLTDDEIDLWEHLRFAMRDPVTFEKGQWLFPLDNRYLEDQDITVKMINDFFKIFGVNPKILREDDNFYLALSLKPPQTPGQFVNKAISLDRTQEQRSIEKGRLPEPSEIKRASRYYFAFTVGNNLTELLQLDIVNPKYTISNNVHHVLSAFGIEAARNYLIKEFLAVISAEGSSVNTQHILIITDYMTRTGSITKINSQTVATRGYGTLTKITTTNALKILMIAGAFGKVEPSAMKEISGSIMVGELANIGTNYGNYPEYEEVLKELIEDERTGRKLMLDPEEVEEAINEIDATNHGAVGEAIDIPEFDLIPPDDEQDIISQLNDEVPPGAEVNPLTAIPPPHNISDHLSTVLSQIKTIPCKPIPEQKVIIEPEIPSTLRTTQLPVIGAREEGEVPTTFEIKLPQPNLMLGLPETLVEEMDAASRVELPEIVSERQTPSVTSEERPKLVELPSQRLPSLTPTVRETIPRRKPTLVALPRAAPTGSRTAPRPTPTGSRRIPREVTRARPKVRQPEVMLPSRGTEPVARGARGFSQLL